VFRSIKRATFAVLSRTCLAIYSRIPVFGPLRAAVGVIRDGDRVLVIDRSDGRGLSFPGGLAWPRETPEQAMSREVSEETHLRVEKASLLFEYESWADVPCVLTVFAVEATGELGESWEGCPRWLPLRDIASRLLPSQRKIPSLLSADPT